jgi:ATP-binding cassette, subfamily B, bacterial PglK
VLGNGYWSRWLGLAALALLASVFEMSGALMVYLMVALLTAPASIGQIPLVGGIVGPITPDALPELRLTVASLVLLFFVVRSLVVIGRAFVEGRVVAAAGVEISDRLLAGYLAMPYQLHMRRNTSELIRTSVTATERLQSSVLLPLVWLVGDALLVVGVMIAVVWIDPVAALAATVMLGGVAFGIQHVLRRRLIRWSRRFQDAVADGLRTVQESLAGLRDIKVLGQEGSFRDAHRRHRQRGARALYLTNAAQAAPRALLEFATVATLVVLTFVTIATGSTIEETLASVGVFAYAGVRLQPTLQRALTSLNQIRGSSAIVDDLLSDLRSVPQAQASDDVGRTDRDDGQRFREDIEVRGLSFTYEADASDRRAALQGIDLRIFRGEFVGICGPTGGGKSTLLDVLVGLLPPTSGSISVDGRELGSEPRWWWEQLGVVSQQIFLTDDTLRRNIAFGVDLSSIDDERLARCVERAQLSETVNQLPEGIDTVVGEQGVRLSGGQRQRVAVARALYREPPVVVLDEGTSALDGATEGRLIEALRAIDPDLTLIAVAHRLSTLRDADRILVIEDGRIVEEGTYDGLSATSGLFRSLARD